MIRSFYINPQKQTKKENRRQKKKDVLVEGIKKMCCQSDAALKEQVDVTEDGTQWCILSKDGEVLDYLYKII